MTVSNQSLIMLAHALRQRRSKLGTKWRRLPARRQALLVVAHLRKGETYADLARGFAIGTTTVYRYLREGITVLAALAPTLNSAIAVATGKAFVVLDGTGHSLRRPEGGRRPPAAGLDLHRHRRAVPHVAGQRSADHRAQLLAGIEADVHGRPAGSPRRGRPRSRR